MEEVEIAFGMFKLRMVMVVEDEQIGVDELYEEIQLMINKDLDDDDLRIQSIDTVSFSKL